MGREMEERFKREGIYVYLWLIHVEIYRKQQNCRKQLSINKRLKKKKKAAQLFCETTKGNSVKFT